MPYTTDLTLLEKITDGDEISWNTFSRIYSPLIRACGKGWNLEEQELDDLVQEVLLSFFRASRTFRYDKSKGRFRNYLQIVVRNNIFRILKGKNGQAGTGSLESEKFLDLTFEDKWDMEWHNYLFSEALCLLRQEMEDLAFQAFYLYAVKDQPAPQVASTLGITVNAVYIHKSRALDLLRRIIRKLENL